MKLAIIDDDINFGEQFRIKLSELFDENVKIDVYQDMELKLKDTLLKTYMKPLNYLF